MLQRRKRKTLRILSRIIFVFFAGAAVSVGVAVRELDINEMKSEIVGAVKSRTGLDVGIFGEMSWKFSLRSQIIANDVRVKNADWARHKYGVAVPKIEVQINLLSLLRGAPTVQSVKMIRPVVNIEENAKGELSIDLKQDGEIRIPEAVRKNEFPFPLDFGVGSVELEGPEIFFVSKDGVESFTPDRLKISLQGKSETMDFSGYLSEKGAGFPFLISFSKYNEKKKNYAVKITLAGDALSLVADIVLNAGKMPVDLSAFGTIQRLPAIGELIGLPLPEIAKSDINLSASMNRKVITVKSLRVESKKSNLSLSGKYDFSKAKPNIVMNIKSAGVELEEFFPGLYDDDGFEWMRPKRPLNVFKDIPLYGELLSAADGKISADVKKLRIYRELSADDIKVNLDVKNGVGIVSANWGFMEGTVRAKVRARDRGEGLLRLRAAGTGEGIVTGDIMASVGELDYVSDLPMNFDFYLESRGRTLEDVIRNANGPIRIASDAAGYAHEGLMEFLYGKDFITSVKESVEDAFTGKKKASRMRISCAVANLLARGGRIDLDRNLAVQTRAVNIRGVGFVDFGRERMDVALDTTPVDGIKLSISGGLINSTVLAGNLAEPDLRWNRDKVMGRIATATGVGLAVGALTGGIGLLVGAGVGLVGGDVLKNWTEDQTPCLTAFREGAPAAKKGDPAFMTGSVDKLVNDFINR